MKIKAFTTGFLFTLTLLICGTSKAQISQGGTPIFKGTDLKSQLKPIELPTIKYDTIDSKSTQNNRLKHARYAYVHIVKYSISEHGIWDELQDGRRVWRFAIKSEGAYSLGLVFSKFKLPESSLLYVYNNKTERVLGAYTHQNNKASGRFSIEPLEGDELIVEYIEPQTTTFPIELEIEAVIHDYKNIFNLLKGKKTDTKFSGTCNIDINCTEGDEWQKEKRSVCHLLYDGWIASGALINNTAMDGKAYLLTAHHAIHEAEVAEIAIFYFNYERSNCSSGNAPRTQSISGSSLKATTSNLDFSLLELSIPPPKSFLPYYAGWDCSGRIPARTVCIHHPSGDAKKIAKDYDSPITASYEDETFRPDTESSWLILDWDLGTTEGGSSGSPLFDEHHRIVGDLTGGYASCRNSIEDYFAKFSVSWDKYPQPENQLKHWLDPINSGTKTLDGYDPYEELSANFSISADTGCVSSPLRFTDLSNPVADTYFWDFGEGASPQTANHKGPHEISYNSSGRKYAKLVVTKHEKKDSITKSLVVQQVPFSDFDYQLQQLTIKLKNNSLDASKFTWNFGDGATSAETNPVHTYASSGKYNVILTAENFCGINHKSQEVNTFYKEQLKAYPNPSTGKFSLDLNHIHYDEISWSVFSIQGSKVNSGTISSFAGKLEFDLTGLQAGPYILKVNIDGEVLTVKLMLIAQ